jgi:hypothetical protein
VGVLSEREINAFLIEPSPERASDWLCVFVQLTRGKFLNQKKKEKNKFFGKQ